MNLYLRTKHWLNDDPEFMDAVYIERKIGRPGASFIYNHCTGATSHVVTAHYDHKLVGFFRLNYWPTANEVTALGTFVASAHRREGLAAALWSRALDRLTPKRVGVYTVSLNGKRFVAAMRRRYRDIAIGWPTASDVDMAHNSTPGLS